MNKMIFFRWLVALMLPLFVATQFSVAGDEQWDSKLVPQGVALTGKRVDFPAGTLAMLEKQEASLGLCNDSQYLCVMLAFRNPMYARTIRKGGLTVWLDASGKKAKDFMIKYTGGPTREQMMALRKQGTEMQERQMPPEMRERMNEMEVDSAPVFICYQKDRISEKPIPVDGSEGPSAVFGVDQGFCVYEFKIPLQESTVRFYGVGVKQGQKISVGFIWGEFSQERGGSHMGFSGGMPGGGGGMRPPDGMGEGPRDGGRGGGMRGMQMPQKQEVWVKAKLGVSGN
jgi:hypothetical protein